jgi:hypothetical protein
MRTTKGSPWIVVCADTPGVSALSPKCKRCGAILHVTLPIDADVYIAMSRAFIKIHTRCREQPAEAGE